MNNKRTQKQQQKNKALQCDICFETYNKQDRQPRVMCCGHTICKDCLQKGITHN